MKDKLRPYAGMICTPAIAMAGGWLHIRLVAACGECAQNHEGLLLTVLVFTILGMVFTVALVWYLLVERRL